MHSSQLHRIQRLLAFYPYIFSCPSPPHVFHSSCRHLPLGDLHRPFSFAPTCAHVHTHHPSNRGHLGAGVRTLGCTPGSQEVGRLINHMSWGLGSGGTGDAEVEIQGREIKGQCVTRSLILQRDLLYGYGLAKGPEICNFFPVFAEACI